MATGSGPGPGSQNWSDMVEETKSAETGATKKSWAEMLGSTISPGLNKNVLEIVLDKDQRGAFVVNHHDCARVMRKIGLDPRPGVHVETVQICPNGRGIILITLKPGIPIESFCIHDVFFEVTSSGIRAVNIKPAGKRDAVVTIKGLHPNTRDEGVLAYLNKFAKSVTNRVIHGAYADGPLQGLKNGDRSYKLEIKPTDNIGTYHIIDGHKVTVRYPGQQQTCARCHETARICKGGGIARMCDAAGGQKVEFSDYIVKLWNTIGYIPGTDLEVAAVYDDHGDEDDSVTEKVGGTFTPDKKVSLPGSFGGVSIRQFPKKTDSGEIMEFLILAGLPESLKDNAVIKPNGTVIVNKLETSVCQLLIDNIHAKQNFGRKLYCNGVIPFTPQKVDTEPLPETNAASSSSSAVSPSSSVVSPSTPTTSSVSNPLVIVSQVNNRTSAQVSTVFSSPGHSTPSMSFGDIGTPDVSTMLDNDYQMKLDENLVRRHSIDGAAATLERSSYLLANLKEFGEQLSDFGSAKESLDSSSDEENTPQNSTTFKTVGGKRKPSRTPPGGRDFFLKKANIDIKE